MKFKLVLDTLCEVYDQLKHLADDKFWDFKKHTVIPGAVYLFGRTQFHDNIEAIKQLAEAGTILPVFSNPAEGSDTMVWQLTRLGVNDLVRQGKILVITGGHIPDEYPHLYLENFLPKVLAYKENLEAIDYYQYRNNWTEKRQYQFLFLNGRGRKHRKYLLNRLQPVLDRALWTNLDPAAGPIQLLPAEYEVEQYRKNLTNTANGFVKYSLFNNQWGDIYLEPKPYLDTHFSLVTETVFDYPYTFRTEKIWKPIAIGHPFIVASNAGYYQDLHNLGFKTFGHLIDESFDNIENNQDRLERIAGITEDLVKQDLAEFSRECYNVCKYNQQLLEEISPKFLAEFPDRFTKFINERL